MFYVVTSNKLFCGMEEGNSNLFLITRNKKIESEISTDFFFFGVQRNMKMKEKSGSTVPISSISNLTIRIVDIVMIQWVRSTYFFFC